MSFKTSLAVGTQGETYARQMLEKLGIDTKESNSKDVDFYLAFESKEYSCECKYDVYAKRSGNVFLEVFNPKSEKPSGIMSTKAVFWFTVFSEHDIFFCLSADLRDFAGKVKPKRVINAAGDKNSDGILYAKDVICGQCLQELTKKNLLEEIKKLT